jgi:hypothetical protein
MWFNLVRRWAILAIAVPLAAAGAKRLSHAIESRRGPSRASRLLRKGADALDRVRGRSRRSRGLFSRRRRRSRVRRAR